MTEKKEQWRKDLNDAFPEDWNYVHEKDGSPAVRLSRGHLPTERARAVRTHGWVVKKIYRPGYHGPDGSLTVTFEKRGDSQ